MSEDKLTPDEEDAYHLLALATSGRPVEQIAQFAASMFLCGGLGADDMVGYFADVMDRVRQLIYDQQSEIWPNLMAGGNQRPLQTENDKAAYEWEKFKGWFRSNFDDATIEDVWQYIYGDPIVTVDHVPHLTTVKLVGKRPGTDLWIVWPYEQGKESGALWAVPAIWDGILFQPVVVESDQELQHDDIIKVATDELRPIDPTCEGDARINKAINDA